MWYDDHISLNAQRLSQKTQRSKFYSEVGNNMEDVRSAELSSDNYEKVGNLNDQASSGDYDVLRPDNTHEATRQSVSNVKRVQRNYGNLANSGFGMRESLVAFRDGVPGLYSGYKIGKARQRQTSLPDLRSVSLTDNSTPNHQKKSKLRIKTPRSQIFLSSDQLSQQKSMDSKRNVVIDNSSHQETGIRYYDPANDSGMSSNATVILPISAKEDLSEESNEEEEDEKEEESWGSEFDESTMDKLYQNDEIYDVIGEPREESHSMEENYMKISIDWQPSAVKKPPLPPRKSIIFDSLDETDLEKDTYIRVEMDTEQEPLQLPPLADNASQVQIKRHQIIRGILENEKMYMKSLKRVVKEYEEPLNERKVVNPDRVKVIFKYIDEILQCHQLFNMALSDRLKEWNEKEVIGDVIYASFSKSMAVKAYSSFVCNFTMAMDSIKETCKLVPAFLNFLKYRLYRNQAKQSLYDLMRQPLERVPQLVVLLEALLQITPLGHPDHLSLQMALTQLECLSEMLTEKRKDSMLKHKVYHLDNHCTGLNKPLASKKRYYVRHDDMLLCQIENGEVVKTKLRRLFLLNDLLVCASHLTKQKQMKLMTSKKYKIKWCLPLNDVDLHEFGCGISVNIHEKTTTIKYSRLVSSPRPGFEKASKLLEDLQHDIAIIGEISGKVASLRRSYKFIDQLKVKTWYNDVKRILERETALANMNWIELSIPVRDFQEQRLNCLFNVHSPLKKIEWTAELENAKLRLSDYNNPGWYLQEENMSIGETAVLRRTVPLLSKSLPLFTTEMKFSIQCAVEIFSSSCQHPIVWLFSGNEHVGHITVIEMDMSSQPHVTESFLACESRVCCAEVVPLKLEVDDSISIWVGTMAGILLVFEPLSDNREPRTAPKLKDAIISIRHTSSKVFVGLANGTVACFRRTNADGLWDFSNPTIVCLGSQSVMSLAEVLGKQLWCACGGDIQIIDGNTLAMEKKLKMSDNSKVSVRHVITYGIGVWISLWKSAKLHLMHAETFEHLQTISITTAIARMKDDIDGRIQNVNVDKIYVTSLLAKEGLLWVGVDQGLILTYPLPKLGGIPTVAGLACVSFHGHQGSVKHLHSFQIERFAHNEFETTDDDDRFRISKMSASSCDLVKSSELSDSNLEPVYYVVEPENLPVEPGNLPVEKKENTEIEITDQSKTFENRRADLESFEREGSSNKATFDSFRRRTDSYDSDEDVDADQEFSFIENERKKKLGSRKRFLNVASDKDVGEIIGAAPELKKNGFAELMENFQGFCEKNDDSLTTLTASNKTNLNVIQEEDVRSDKDDNIEHLESNKNQRVLTESNQVEHSATENTTFERSINKKNTFERSITEKNTLEHANNNILENVTQKNTMSVKEEESDKSTLKFNPTSYEAPIEVNNVSEEHLPDNATVEHEDYELLAPENLKQHLASFPQYDSNGIQNADIFEQTEDFYKKLPLPQSPEIIEDLNVSPSAISTPKASNDRLVRETQYTPLISNDHSIGKENISASGVSAFEREISLDSHASRSREGDYASLVALTKRNEESKKYLLNPRFVFSIGTGHVDFRKRTKTSSSLDFFRSFSSTEKEPLLLIWKLS